MTFFSFIIHYILDVLSLLLFSFIVNYILDILPLFVFIHNPLYFRYSFSSFVFIHSPLHFRCSYFITSLHILHYHFKIILPTQPNLVVILGYLIPLKHSPITWYFHNYKIVKSFSPFLYFLFSYLLLQHPLPVLRRCHSFVSPMWPSALTTLKISH